jgi:N-acyl-D-amino-acid deacylase
MQKENTQRLDSASPPFSILNFFEMFLRTLCVLVALVLSGCATAPQPPPSLNLKIVNARVVDGTGAPWFRADVGVRGDTIVSIGDLDAVTASTVIDAQDHIVAPGFIDLLGWSFGSALIDPNLEGKVRQGVTTELGGEGNSPGPISEEAYQERAQNEPNQPNWHTLGDFMRVIEQRGSALNFAFLVGATNARTMVLGTVNRDPSAEDMIRMEQIVDQAMREGAVGLSTSLIYVPAVFSKTEEIIRLARVAAKYQGVYFSHIRNEADEIIPALDEAFEIGRQAQIPVNIWHMKVALRKNWGRMPEVIGKIEQARREGLDVAGNVYPYEASSTGLTTILPSWSLEGGYAALLERLKDPEQRLRIVENVRASYFEHRLPSDVLVTGIANPAMQQYERRRLSEIAEMMGVDHVEAAMRLFEASPRSPSAIYFSMNEEDMEYALKQPWVSVGSDAGTVVGQGRSAGTHPRAYGTFPRVVGRYVRDEPLFTLEEAVRKITSQAASRVKIEDRGILRPGMKADLVVFDPQQVRDLSTYDDPHQLSVGIREVIVNGVPVLRGGVMTGALPGRILRGKGYVKP